MKNKISTRGKINRFLACSLLIAILLLLYYFTRTTTKETSAQNSIPENKQTEKKIESTDYVQLSVPLVTQTDEPSLYNGCEVSSLAMILQYNGFDISKNDLANDISVVPFEEGDLMGDPNEGFVGSISGDEGPGYSAYSPVILELAKKEVDSSVTVKDLTNESFNTILSQLLDGNPVWVITTTDFTAPTAIETWETANGSVDISWDVHSVVLTGFDADFIYLNDPYGEKMRVDREDFIESWEQMGSQALTLIPA